MSDRGVRKGIGPSRRTVLGGALGLTFGASSPAWAAAPASSGPVTDLYRRSIVIDSLAMPSTMNVPWPSPDGPLSNQQVLNVQQSGITAINVTVGDRGQTRDEVMTSLAFWDSQIAAHPDVLVAIDETSDILKAKRAGKTGLIYGTQDSTMLDHDPTSVEMLASRGVRVIQLTYNGDNDVGSGCMVAADKGLTRYGHDVVAEIERNHVVLDTSHGGARTTREAIAAAARPPMISHTGCRAIFDHPRNTYDETLKAVARKGGVVGIYLMPYLGGGPGAATADLLIDHLAHALNVCGADHVGIGSDLSLTPIVEDANYRRAETEILDDRRKRGVFAPGDDRPVFIPELNSPQRMERIATRLAQRGYPAAVTEKVIGANFMRLFTEVWARRASAA